MARKTIERVRQSQCCGCGACQNACPKDAIEMRMDRTGFYVPHVDHDKCVECGLCTKSCPVLNVPGDNAVAPEAYAVKSDKKVMRGSTSAGVFAQLAEQILSQGGYVCGAAYNDTFEVHHLLTNTKPGMEKIRKTKYVQSQIGLVYRDIKKLLADGQLVLFSGTPCQVAGLYTYLKKKYDNLYTMDILCHGVPAPGNWNKYLEENFDISQLKDIDFRHKGNHGFKKHHICFTLQNGEELIQPSGKNIYYRHFTRDLGLRDSCANCEFAVFPRQGDISAGDFWGAQKLYPELIENDKGLSVLLINNAHGKELFEKIRGRFTLLKPLTHKEAMTGNRKTARRQHHNNKEEFFKMVPFNSFSETADKYVNKPYDVAIYGNTIGSNYGGRVTYYALYKAVQKLGYSAVMLHPPIPQTRIVPETDALRFSKKHMMVGEPLLRSELGKYNDIANTFLLGSDQIWNYTLFPGRRTSMYLDFVDNSKKKVAYGSSFGFDVPTIFPDHKDKYPVISKLMKQMDYIGVREADGVTICEDYFDVDATHVMDPVFLLNEQEYEVLAKDAKNKPEGPYMAVYTLTPGKKINPSLQYVSKKLKLPRVNMGPGTPKKFEEKKKNFDEPYCENLQLEEWIYNIKNADFVVTDSYHCTCFAIIFRKPFVLIQESWATSRISSLLTKLNLTDRWFHSTEDLIAHSEVLTTPIDYDAVYKILDKEIHKSMSWLRNALAAPKVYTPAEPVEPDAYVKKAYQELYESTDLNTYWKAVKKYQDDFVVAMVNCGDVTANLEGVNFPKTFQIGPKTKAKMNRPLAYICDLQRQAIRKNRGEFAHAVYHCNGVKIVANNEKETEGNTATAIYVEKDGIRTAYQCPGKGLYALVYSKPADRVVDFIRCDLEKDAKLRIHRNMG